MSHSQTDRRCVSRRNWDQGTAGTVIKLDLLPGWIYQEVLAEDPDTY